MNVTWWCAAQTGPWTWAPQAYPGIWLFQLGLLGLYVWALLRVGPSRVAPGEPVATRAQVGWFLLGWVLLWITLDWPLGPLAAGYLLSAHMVQYVLIIWFAAPLLESGLPSWMRSDLLASRALAPLGWIAARPFRAFLLFNVVLVLTHVPYVADTLKPLQFGSMAIDLLWVGSAFLFWLSTSPAREPQRPEVAYGRQFLYVMGIKVIPILLGAFLVLADFPLYRTFELAARAIEDVPALNDQVFAGWLMWMGTTPLLIYRLARAFFTWHALEESR